MDCLFCSIVQGDIPSKKVYEDELCYAFLDINPQAPVHCLLIPKEHIGSLAELQEHHAELAAHLLLTIGTIAKQLGLTNGYRVVSNVGDDGCQSVKHLHFHILGGKKLSEQMS